MEEFMSENNSGAVSNEQNKENKRQRFDPAKQEGGRPRSRNQNHRRRNNGPRQGGNDNKKRDNQDAQQTDNKNRERNSDRQNGRDKRNNFKREQNQGGEKKPQQFSSERKPKPKRSREFGDEVAKNVKKVETIDDIRSDNARITKEIYLEIASLKNINLN